MRSSNEQQTLKDETAEGEAEGPDHASQSRPKFGRSKTVALPKHIDMDKLTADTMLMLGKIKKKEQESELGLEEVLETSTDQQNDKDGAEMYQSAARLAIEADYADLTGLSGVISTNQAESKRSTNRQADGGEPL